MTLVLILAALGLGWSVTLVVPQMPQAVGQESQLAEQWLAQQQAAAGSWGSFLRLLSLFDVSHAFWFTLLWAALAASFSVGLADTMAEAVGLSPAGRRGSPSKHVMVGRLLIYGGALLALGGVYWGDQRGWFAEMSLVPGQGQVVAHGLPWTLRFEGFEGTPATTGSGRELHGRVSLLGLEDSPVTNAPLSAQHPFRYDNLSVRPVWFGRRVRIRVHDGQGYVVLAQRGGGVSAGEVTLYFGRDDTQELLLSRDWRLAVNVRLDEEAVALELSHLAGGSAGRAIQAVVSPPATVELANFTVQVESETYATLDLHYLPGRKLLWGGLGMAVIGLATLILSNVVMACGVLTETLTTRPN